MTQAPIASAAAINTLHWSRLQGLDVQQLGRHMGRQACENASDPNALLEHVIDTNREAKHAVLSSR